MKTKLIYIALLISILSLGSVFMKKQGGEPVAHIVSQPVYERVMKTRMLRCSYEIWPPFITKDPNTGKLGGFYYDLMERFGKDTGLKIEWLESSGVATMFESFRAGRTDMHCFAVTPSPERAMVADFTRPIGYMPFHLYVKASDHRFDQEIKKANSSDIKMMSIDGYIGAIMTKEFFPKAKLITLPNLSTDADVLLSVASGKVDAAICEPVTGADYIKNNPGKIKRVQAKPLRFPSMAMALPIGEQKFKALVDSALTYYIETGIIDALYKRYELSEDKVLRPMDPYKVL